MRSLALTVLPLIAGCTLDFALHESEDEQWFPEAIRAVEVDLEAGAATLVGVDRETGAAVSTWSRWSQKPPSVDMAVEDGVLVVEGRCPRQISCATDIRIGLPRGATIDAITDAGPIVVRDTEGDLVVETGSGRIDVDNHRGPADLLTDAGEIEGTRLFSSEVYADTGAGPIFLQVGGPVSRVEADTGAGGIEIEVPAGPYRLDLASGAGAIRLDGVEHQAGASARIHADTGAGGIHVSGR